MRAIAPALGLALVTACTVPPAMPAPDDAGPPQRPARPPRTVDDRLEFLLDRLGVPGVSIMVVVGDSIADQRSEGVADPETGAPMTPDVVLRAGEAARLVLGLAAARLADQGRLDPEAAVGGAVPGLLEPVGDASVAQLLSHTGGLASGFVRGPVMRDELDIAARWLTALDVVAPPGSFVSLSPPGLLLAARAVERAAGAAYPDVAREQVLAPLGMTRSTVDPERIAALEPAPGHGSPDGRPSPELTRLGPADDSVVHAPRNGLYASTRDLARLAAALLSDGVVEGERVLPEGVAAAVARPREPVPWLESGATQWYGWGSWFVEWEGRRELRVFDARHGHTVAFRLLPDAGIGVIATANSAAPLMDVTDVVLRRILGLPDRPERRSGAPDPTPVPLDRPEALAGTWRNGAETIVIEHGDAGLALVSGDIRLALGAESDGVLRARIADGRVAMAMRLLQDAEERYYLYYGKRAFRRMD